MPESAGKRLAKRAVKPFQAALRELNDDEKKNRLYTAHFQPSLTVIFQTHRKPKRGQAANVFWRERSRPVQHDDTGASRIGAKIMRKRKRKLAEDRNLNDEHRCRALATAGDQGSNRPPMSCFGKRKETDCVTSLDGLAEMLTIRITSEMTR